MRSSFVVGSGAPLAKTPNLRRQAARRRWMVVGGMLTLALVSGAIGSLTAGRQVPNGSVETGPFSYFPYQ
ncbi:hypothetical protein LRS10_04675 [Phenylobacterium sp. J426]|uniref:hypothetical protein n=1 Tax=Phenylobacterium sp. J426 TaxID=2898439 RepID=UPI0021511A00|nr:hypothetical protein [Phenylobacterium sp. J426]MCR5873539.1 hypothetical protein [Phenylobacterium sp. J426]